MPHLFDLENALEHVRHVLPAQGPIKDFIHYNTLHAFQHLEFNDAIQAASHLYHTNTSMPLQFYRQAYLDGKINPSILRQCIQEANWSQEASPPETTLRERCQVQLDTDWDMAINPILIRLTANFLDQGIGLWTIPFADLPFFQCVGHLAKSSMLPIASFVSRTSSLAFFAREPQSVIRDLLNRIVGDPQLFEQYILETLMAHKGWSGMVNQVEIKPSALLKQRHIRLVEFLALKLILEWEFICSRTTHFVPLSQCPVPPPSLEQPGSDAVAQTWQRALENSYYFEVLTKLDHNIKQNRIASSQPPHIQAVFCLDDRECSFRRHLEELDPGIETFGTAGFFGIDFYFQSLNDAVPVQMCPLQIKPNRLIREIPLASHQKEFEQQKRAVQKKARMQLQLNDASSSVFLGFLSANILGYLSAFKLILGLLRPKRLLRSLLTKKITVPTMLTLMADRREVDSELQEGFTIEEMATRVHGVLLSMGLVHFSPLVVVLGHGSSSANNPHFAAYDCGACSGKSGAANARVFAAMANIPQVRQLVAEKGILIPESTRFVGGHHNTCTSEVDFFDTDGLSQQQASSFKSLIELIFHVKGKNAQERCRRFALAKANISPEDAIKEIEHRATALFEPRPELGHATNAVCIVGRRALSKSIFLDRRAFLNSYDPRLDLDGEILNKILSAVIPVCGGINLEYYFSRIDPGVYGSGTKLSHNVSALIGVFNGVDDDLRTGLPIQMTEIHDPIRLLFVVEQTPSVLTAIFEHNPAVFEWIKNGWVKLACIDSQASVLHIYNPKSGFVKFRPTI